MSETNGYDFHEEVDGEEFLTEAVDHEILMHRDAHFGGSFDVMLEYYQSEKIGVNPDFDIERISYLAAIEKENRQNLAPMILTAQEAEQVATARKAYRDFKTIYEINSETCPKLIADLILTEEEEPTAEIQAIVDQGAKCVPELLAIIKSDHAYDPLFPGYGYAPMLAMACLSEIKDERAIIPIFEAIGRESVFGDDPAFEALAALGQKAKEFLLKILTSRPLTKDNLNAACALSFFHPDVEIATVSFNELKKPECRSKPELAAYLLCHADVLENTPLKEDFIKASKENAFPRAIKLDMEKIIKAWER